MKSLRRLAVLLTAAMTLLASACPQDAFAKPNKGRGSTGSTNNIYIHHQLSLPKTQVVILQDYTGNINANSLIDKDTKLPITLLNAPNCYGAVNPAIWYFYLAPRQTAQLTDYTTKPVRLAFWVPVDSSMNGQNPSTCWFSNSCFSYPFTLGSPSNATPAGATFVEFNVSNSTFDTVDISEVNGVNAAWSVDLPTGWTNQAYSNAANQLIPVSHIANNPGPSPNFYGDYGNPGVYPFGCTNCASRYNNVTTPPSPPGTQKSGCLQADFNAPVTYPTFDVGCNNAINYYPNNANPTPTATRNAALAAYQNPPPGVPPLPLDRFYSKQRLYDIAANPPIPFVGYGICELQRGSTGLGGDIDVTLLTYPYGQIQP